MLVRTSNIVYQKEFVEKTGVFKDRRHAGEMLALALRELTIKPDLVLAVPRGGVPVAVMLANILCSRMDLAVCRKLLIPWDREAGFGAVDPDGNVYVDRELASYLGLSNREIDMAVKEQLEEIKHRNILYRKGKPYPSYESYRSIVLVDDGIAAGYTMHACTRFIYSHGAHNLVIAVPTCHTRTAEALSKNVDLLVCLNPRSGPIYAVADAYIEWHDLSDEEVIKALERNRVKNCDGRTNRL